MKKMKSMVAWMLVLAMVCTNVDYVRAATVEGEDSAPVEEVEDASEATEDGEAEEVVEIVAKDGADESLSVPAMNALFEVGYWRGMQWEIDANGELTISGTYDYEGWDMQNPPWSFAAKIETAKITANRVKSTYAWFEGCRNLTSVDLNNFDTGNVTDMSSMFKGCSGLTSLDVSRLDTGNVTDMSSMFKGCSGLTSLDVSHFDTGKVTDMDYMFYDCSGLTSLDVSHFDTGKVTCMGDMFCGCSGLTSLDVSYFDTGKVTDMSCMFYGCSGLTSLDVSNFDTGNVTDMSCMFYDCSGLTSLDVSHFGTGKVTGIGDMFYGCSGLTSLDVSHFDTGKVTDMEGLFEGCSGLTSLDVSHFDTGKVTDMEHMFEGCSGLTSLDVSHFDTGKVTDMDYMFYDCSELTSLDVSHFDTGKVTCMGDMFRGCSGLTSLDVSNFDTSNVGWMYHMFYGCSGLTSLDVSHFDTGNVGRMDSMFRGCSGLTSLDMSHFDTGKVVEMEYMFSGCSGLAQIKSFKSLSKMVSLPRSFFDAAGNEYTEYFPENLTESIWLCKTQEMAAALEQQDAQSANQFKLCARDSSTKQLIPNAHIIVDGVDYKVNSKGYVTLTVDAEDTTEHAIHAVANGYMQKPYQMLQIKGGESYTFYLDSMSDAIYYSSYIVGTLKNEVDLDDGKIKIDDSWYKCSAAVNSDLYGKTVVGFLVDGTITDLRNAEDYYVLASSVPSGGRTFVYQNGAYNVPYMLTTSTFESKLSNSDIKLPAGVTGEKTITNISVKAGSNLRIALSETGSYQESVVISNANQKINANQSYKLNIYVKPRDGYVPEQTSAYDTVRFSVTYDDGKELSFCRIINFSNGDVAAEKKSTRMNSDSNTTLKNVKANLDSNLLFDAYIFKTTLGMSNAEVKSINELLTAWVLSLDATTDTVNELTQDEKMLQQVLKKMGVNIPKFDWLTGSKSSATIQVEVQTSGFGKVVLLFTYDGLEYHWDRKEPFAKSAVIYWQVYKSDKQVPDYLMEKRMLDMYVKADTDRFYTQIRSLAMDAIKDCYNQWGGNADKVAEEIIDKRILALVNYKFKSTSNMVFTLISNPAKRTAGYELCKASCPVDLYVYNAEGKLVGSLVDDVAYPVDDGVVVYMDGETKVVLCCNDSYTIQFVGNGTGTMQYVVSEYDSTGEQTRELQYHDVPLTDGIVYKESIPEEINVSPERFDLIKEDGEAITASSDTMPPEEKIVRAEGIQLDQTSLALTAGDEAVLAAMLEPTDATIQDVVWSSSDETILTVKDGKINALAAGEAEVTATAVDGMYSAVCTVTIQAKVVPVTAVALDKSTISLKAKETATLTATLSPADATDKTVTWSSSDDKVATVDANGKVTAVAKGTATITVTTKDGNFTASCTVTVTENGDSTGGSTDEPTDNSTDNPADDSKVKQDTSRIFVLKQKQDITAFFTAATPYKKYTVTPKGTATVSAKGILTAKKPAETLTVTGLVKEGKQWKEAEYVTFKIEKPVITAKTITATRAGAVMDAVTNISGTTLQPTSWLSSKPAVAEIDAKTGLITTKTKGTAKITAVYGEGKNAAKYTFNVKVSIPVMSKTKATLLTGGILQLKLKNVPKTGNGAGQKASKTGAGTGGAGTSGVAASIVQWSSSDAKSVTVDDTGKVTVLSYNGKIAGKATITATYDGVSYSCEIEVKKPELKKTSLTMKQGKAQKLTFKNTKLKNAKWTSLNEKVATVDDTGRVTGVSSGTAVIQAVVGGVTVKCEVEVE